MATTPTAPAEPQAEISALGRVTGTLFNPKATFADIARKPSWVVPIVLLTVISLAFCYVMNQRIDWRTYIRQQIEASPRAANMPADQKERIIEQQAKWTAPSVYVFGGLGAVGAMLFLGLVYWGAFNLLAGAQMRYGQSIGITAHAQLPGLISAPIGILVMYLKEYGDVTPENILATNLGAFLTSDSSKWLKSLAGSIEIFWFWQMFLLAVGYSLVNPKKVSFGKALGIIGGIWVLWVVVKVGWAAIFS